MRVLLSSLRFPLSCVVIVQIRITYNLPSNLPNFWFNLKHQSMSDIDRQLPAILANALINCKHELTRALNIQIQNTTFTDVENAIKAIESQQKKSRCFRNTKRIQPFIDCMQQIGSVIEVFTNASSIVAYVWVGRNPPLRYPVCKG